MSSIINLVNPLAWGAKLATLKTTASQDDYIREDIEQLLSLGQVGAGNAKAYSDLISYNQKLNLTPNLLELMGGASRYAESMQMLHAYRGMYLDFRNKSLGIPGLGTTP